MEKYLLRSMLYVPAYKEKFIEKALGEKADALIFDLEDAVPENFKPEARKILKSYIDKGAFKGKMVLVRLNSLKSNHTLEDLRYAVHEDIDGFMVSKITRAEEISFYDELLSKLEAEYGIENGHFKLTILIETTSAVMDAYRICTASDRVIAACFGGEDYLNDVHGVHSEPPHVFDYPRAVIITAARAAGILPIDSPYLAVHDEEGFMKEERLSYEMGFAGIQVLSPR